MNHEAWRRFNLRFLEDTDPDVCFFSTRMFDDVREQHVFHTKYQGPEKCVCGSKNLSIRQIQTRSADEGMTTISMCLDCNKKW